jgi:ribosomal protein S12 methylthiotransferase accessory factor
VPSQKRYRRGTHRTLDPGATVAALQPWLRPAGITRVANITGLDVIGIPVVLVARPNARTNAVFQGKGLDLAAAKASGLMEAIETWCAERVAKPPKRACASAIDPSELPADLGGLPLMAGVIFDADIPMLWTEGRDIRSGRAAWVPYELVHADFRVPYMPATGQFAASTSGLASGNNWLEAVSHGICELVERDATALFKLHGGPAWERRVQLSSIDDPDAADLVERMRSAGLDVGVWDLTTDIRLPVFGCHIMEAEGGPDLLPLPAEGYGCHPDRSIALIRGLTEAAQSRLTALSGARDDIGPRFYGEPESADTLTAWRRVLASKSWGKPFHECPNFNFETLEEDLECELHALASAGMAEVFAVDIATETDFPFSVVRTIIPGLEGELSPRFALGRRGQGTTRVR